MIILNPGEEQVFDIYFTSIVSMAHCHPGAGRSNGYGIAQKLSIDECADLAYSMLEKRRDIHTQSFAPVLV